MFRGNADAVSPSTSTNLFLVDIKETARANVDIFNQDAPDMATALTPS